MSLIWKILGFHTREESMYFIKARITHSKRNTSGRKKKKKRYLYHLLFHIPSPVSGTFTLHKEFRWDISFPTEKLFVFSTSGTASKCADSPEKNCSIQTDDKTTSLNENLFL